MGEIEKLVATHKKECTKINEELEEEITRLNSEYFERKAELEEDIISGRIIVSQEGKDIRKMRVELQDKMRESKFYREKCILYRQLLCICGVYILYFVFF